MTETFDAVVVGSGFGGAVVAARLAEAGRSVLVLERGRAYPPGSFPRTPAELEHALWDPAEDLHGLYDVWRFRRLDALVSAGLGGGSLIYANVLLRRPAGWFVDGPDEHWPITLADLEPHYIAVEAALGATPFPDEHLATTPKVQAFRDAAKAAHLEWEPVNLAVTFAPGEGAAAVEGAQIDEPEGNLHGAPRTTCRGLGECDLGCTIGAKNTLDFTYLSRAWRAGAQVRTLCEVHTLAPLDADADGDGGAGWRIGYTVHDAARTGHGTEPPDGPAERIAHATRLVLAAGTLGTQRLLRRNANALPVLSRRLGHGVSANGDLLTFAVGCTQELRPSRGPVITTTVARREGEGGAFLQDAGFPAIGEWIFHGIGAAPGLWKERRVVLDLVLSAFRKRADANVSAELSRLLGAGSGSAHLMPLLGMGRDVASGRFGVGPGGELECDWSIDASRPFFEELLDTARDVAEGLGGELVDTAIGELDRIITVHPVGGCAMGRDVAEGVVDPWGRVHRCRGLYVADGSVMPGAVGANPSLTIAAFAERVATAVLGEPRETPVTAGAAGAAS